MKQLFPDVDKLQVDLFIIGVFDGRIPAQSMHLTAFRIGSISLFTMGKKQMHFFFFLNLQSLVV